MQMLNTQTGELAPAHLGETEDGRKIYLRVEGWELANDEGQSIAMDDNVESDEDGNYIVT